MSEANSEPMSEPTSEPLVEARALRREHEVGGTRVLALDHLDLSVRRGEFVAIMGPSGSGKSTLLNILGGLDQPSGGSVRHRGDELTRADEGALTRYRREHVGFVFQFYNLIPSLTARENVAIVTEIAEKPLAPEAALTLVGLGARFDHFPSQLSGGEQQSVAIARAIAKRPVVMLCDEPTGALDSATGVQVLQALEQANRDLQTTTVVITHNADIARMADRVLTMANGRIVEERRNTARISAAELRW